MFTKLTGTIALVQNGGATPVLTTPQAALDLIATARYECKSDALVVQKQDVAEDFFDLKTRLAGEILQKFVNYSCRLAIVGDFSAYTSKALRDFIYESNNGSTVFFVPTVEEALAKLEKATAT